MQDLMIHCKVDATIGKVSEYDLSSLVYTAFPAIGGFFKGETTRNYKIYKNLS